MKPQEKHLQTRAEYLVKLLHQESIVTKADELRKVTGRTYEGHMAN